MSAGDELRVLEPFEELQAYWAHSLRIGASDPLQHAWDHLCADLRKPFHPRAAYWKRSTSKALTTRDAALAKAKARTLNAVA
jgi:hypothetical protein